MGKDSINLERLQESRENVLDKTLISNFQLPCYQSIVVLVRCIFIDHKIINICLWQ